MRMDKNAANSRFILFYKVFVIVLVVLAAAVLVTVWVILKKYQSDFDNKDSEEIWTYSQTAFEDFVNSKGVEYWVDLWYEQNPESFDSEDKVAELFRQLLSEPLSFKKAADYEENSPVYVIECGETQFVEISLSGAETEWVVSDVSFRLKGEKEAEITVPKGCSVSCSGILLDEKYCVDEDDSFFVSQYKDSLKNPYNPVTWKVAEQLTEPELEVVPPAGMTISDDGNGRPVLIMDGAGAEAILERAEVFFDQYNKYGLYGYYDVEYNAAETARMCKKDSQIYEVIYAAIDAMEVAPCHSVYETEKTIEPVMVWAENAVSVDIAFSTETTYMGTEKDYFEGEFRILFIDFGDGYEICGISQQN